ncbi:conserved hypothetical protein [Histoplasma mississippiense (nom. inval.)]|uniref:conserved hypothetical protein n=1 Tax=Ajellomyces capsulatus (strain NAm1 / WU24) TaxID=2059318 RepID=UPI000157C093|nr:conserved hypothetical protein [Histoplasma mississippiense (nom. inval.)]EDN06653.1 conserved hypothetical protein [Histoplasma mississippiense (nom. inval.)]
MLQSTILLALASTSLASFAGNLNYRSPSHNHPALGISIPKVLKCSDPLVEYSVDNLDFTHGIASGDPYPNSVILWTRCAPSSENVNECVASEGGGQLYDSVPIYGDSESNARVSKAPVCVEYNVSPDKGFNQIADRGTVYTSSDIDFTVKVREKLLSMALVGNAGCDAEPDSTNHQVEASHLKPFTTYYYKFNVCGSEKSSPIGRAKTSPTEYDEVADISLAVYSCSNFVNGYFNAYGNTARKDSVDYVVHLGDGSSIGRKIYPQKTIYTLYEYRKRHATHKTDEDLLLSHQTFTWIPVWDDHEVADNTYRDGSSLLRNIEGSFIFDGGVSVDQRKMNAVRAYFEWMPIRQVAMDDNLRIWRNFKFGNLFDLIMLDTRHYDRSITDLYLNSGYIRKIADDIGRSMMGPRQEYWFYESLKSSAKRQATWRVIGSQTVFSRVDELGSIGLGVNVDSWDGYRSNLNRTLRTLYENNIGNNIVIAGDSHANWVSDLTWLDEYPYDPATGEGAIGAEFAGTAVTSSGPTSHVGIGNLQAKTLINKNRELQWSELYYRGYFELTLSHTRTDAKFFAIPDIKKRSPLEISMANFTVIAGENRLTRTNGSPSTNGQGVHNGALKNGRIQKQTVQYNTETKEWSSI